MWHQQQPHPSSSLSAQHSSSNSITERSPRLRSVIQRHLSGIRSTHALSAATKRRRRLLIPAIQCVCIVSCLKEENGDGQEMESLSSRVFVHPYLMPVATTTGETIATTVASEKRLAMAPVSCSSMTKMYLLMSASSTAAHLNSCDDDMHTRCGVFDPQNRVIHTKHQYTTSITPPPVSAVGDLRPSAAAVLLQNACSSRTQTSLCQSSSNTSSNQNYPAGMAVGVSTAFSRREALRSAVAVGGQPMSRTDAGTDDVANIMRTFGPVDNPSGRVVRLMHEIALLCGEYYDAKSKGPSHPIPRLS